MIHLYSFDPRAEQGVKSCICELLTGLSRLISRNITQSQSAYSLHLRLHQHRVTHLWPSHETLSSNIVAYSLHQHRSHTFVNFDRSKSIYPYLHRLESQHSSISRNPTRPFSHSSLTYLHPSNFRHNLFSIVNHPLYPWRGQSRRFFIRTKQPVPLLTQTAEAYTRGRVRRSLQTGSPRRSPLRRLIGYIQDTYFSNSVHIYHST